MDFMCKPSVRVAHASGAALNATSTRLVTGNVTLVLMQLLGIDSEIWHDL